MLMLIRKKETRELGLHDFSHIKRGGHMRTKQMLQHHILTRDIKTNQYYKVVEWPHDRWKRKHKNVKR